MSDRLKRMVGAIAGISLIVGVAAAKAQDKTDDKPRASLPELRISDNGHYLVKQDGTPFFWLSDTAWGLFDHPTLQQAEGYLDDRQKKGFTVIQAVALHWDGLNHANPDGQLALINRDPTKPNDKYFDEAGQLIDKVAAHGMYTAVVPLWFKTYINAKPWLLTPQTAESYGKYLGARWRDKPIVWILGGDTPGGPPRDPDHTPNSALRDICRALAKGLHEGDGGAHLITYHPTGSVDGQSSSWWFHNEPWLSFNALQSGHFIQNHNYKIVTQDWQKAPIKPVIDLESGYENITDRLVRNGGPNVKRIRPWDVRRYAYLSVFAGAAGYTYGNVDIFGFSLPTTRPGGYGDGLGWQASMQRPAAGQMQFLRKLIESRPMLERIPDQSMLVGEAKDTTDRIEATRAADGSYAFVFDGSGRPFELKLGALTGSKLNAWWYSPRDGTAQAIGTIDKTDSHAFTPPSNGVDNDWVLVLDDAAKNYPPPGEVVKVQ